MFPACRKHLSIECFVSPEREIHPSLRLGRRGRPFCRDIITVAWKRWPIAIDLISSLAMLRASAASPARQYVRNRLSADGKARILAQMQEGNARKTRRYIEMNELSGHMNGRATIRRKGARQRHPGRCVFRLANRALRSSACLMAYEPP
jgi:hypothetical protein